VLLLSRWLLKVLANANYIGPTLTYGPSWTVSWHTCFLVALIVHSQDLVSSQQPEHRDQLTVPVRVTS